VAVVAVSDFTFGSFAQGLDVGGGLPPRQDVALRVAGEDVSRQAEDEALDELGLLVLLLQDNDDDDDRRGKKMRKKQGGLC